MLLLTRWAMISAVVTGVHMFFFGSKTLLNCKGIANLLVPLYPCSIVAVVVVVIAGAGRCLWLLAVGDPQLL